MKKQTFIHSLLALTILSVAALAAEPTEPGVAYTDRQLGGTRPGSLLIYNVYSSAPTGGTDENTEISLTNTNNVNAAFVHLFFVSTACATAATKHSCSRQTMGCRTVSH